MNNIKKVKRKFLNASLACSCFLFTIPNVGNCTPSASTAIFRPYSTDFDLISYDLLNQANWGNIEGIERQLKNVAELLETSDDPVTDSCRFLQDLVNKLNAQCGTSLTLSDMLQLTKESIHEFQIPDNQVEKYLIGLDLIDFHQSILHEVEPLGFVRLAGHHKRSSFWTWLTVATITVAAVTLCIVVPQAATAVIGGAVEVGKAALGK